MEKGQRKILDYYPANCLVIAYSQDFSGDKEDTHDEELYTRKQREIPPRAAIYQLMSKTAVSKSVSRKHELTKALKRQVIQCENSSDSSQRDKSRSPTNVSSESVIQPIICAINLPKDAPQRLKTVRSETAKMLPSFRHIASKEGENIAQTAVSSGAQIPMLVSAEPTSQQNYDEISRERDTNNVLPHTYSDGNDREKSNRVESKCKRVYHPE
jgi:hypothetical protein